MDITPASQSVIQNNAQVHHEYKNLLEGIHFKFPTFKHDHPAVIDVNQVADEQLTVGQKVADKVASTVGSWRFIIIQSCILLAWFALNSLASIFHWDPYPFILLNLAYHSSSIRCTFCDDVAESTIGERSADGRERLPLQHQRRRGNPQHHGPP